MSTKSGGPGTACCQLCIPLTHSVSLKAPVDSCRTHSLHITSIHSHAYPKHLDDLRQMAPGPMSLSSLSPFPTQDKLKNLDVGYLKSLRWSVFPSCVLDRKTSFYPKEDRKDHRGGTQMVQVSPCHFLCVPQIYGLVLNSRERSHVPLPESQGLLVVMLKWKWLMGG